MASTFVRLLFPNAFCIDSVAPDGSGLGGRLVVLMNGAANIGAGGIPEAPGDPKQSVHAEKAALYFRELALLANRGNISIDLFCCGLKNFHVKVSSSKSCLN